MGQTAVLSCLDKDQFQKLATHPESYEYYKVARLSESFNKTFEGLRFVLSKGKSAEIVALISQLFEPSIFVGEEIDYENLDWENVTADTPLDGTAVYYHPPTTVQALANFLSTVTDDQFKKAFDPDELNREDIYPGDVWNREVDENIAYNERSMLSELHLLQTFFAKASASNHYCVCYVG